MRSSEPGFELKRHAECCWEPKVPPSPPPLYSHCMKYFECPHKPDFYAPPLNICHTWIMVDSGGEGG